MIRVVLADLSETPKTSRAADVAPVDAELDFDTAVPANAQDERRAAV